MHNEMMQLILGGNKVLSNSVTVLQNVQSGGALGIQMRCLVLKGCMGSVGILGSIKAPNRCVLQLGLIGSLCFGFVTRQQIQDFFLMYFQVIFCMIIIKELCDVYCLLSLLVTWYYLADTNIAGFKKVDNDMANPKRNGNLGIRLIFCLPYWHLFSNTRLPLLPHQHQNKCIMIIYSANIAGFKKSRY